MLAFVLALASAHAADAPGCSKTSIGKLAKQDEPVVLVLGERKGTLPDLSRAARLVRKLLKRGSVTLALQAVPSRHQGELDQYARGGLSIEVLPERLEWETSWGFPFEAYAPLFATARNGTKLVAIGERYVPPPEGEAVQVPPGYVQLLEDPMGENPIPVELESRYATFVAWADHRFADEALKAWDGTGALVIVVDRFHVEGGLGVQWQARTLTQAPVTGVLLAEADSRCYQGDLVLK
ncbi:MAG: ChaN family lipoprotein [Myxococcota bacterium]